MKLQKKQKIRLLVASEVPEAAIAELKGAVSMKGPEVRLMWAIIETAIRDLRLPYNDMHSESARRLFDGRTIQAAELINLDTSYVLRVLREYGLIK